MEKVIDLEGTEVTLYSIGEVEWFSLKYNRMYRTKGCKRRDGYRKVTINGKHYFMHRLMAEAFIPNPDNLPEVDHIIPLKNGGTNDVSNLRWCSHKENLNNPMSLKNKSEAHKGVPRSEEVKRKISDGGKGKGVKPVKCTNLMSGEVREFSSATEAARVLGIKNSNISACCRGRLKSAGGWCFEYKNA